MSDINPTLDLIDGALHDWATSGDAMRWTPEPETREETRELASGGVILPGRVWLDGREITGCVSEIQLASPPTPNDEHSAWRDLVAGLENVTFSVSGFFEPGITDAFSDIAKALEEFQAHINEIRRMRRRHLRGSYRLRALARKRRARR